MSYLINIPQEPISQPVILNLQKKAATKFNKKHPVRKLIKQFGVISLAEQAWHDR